MYCHVWKILLASKDITPIIVNVSCDKKSNDLLAIRRGLASDSGNVSLSFKDTPNTG